MFLFRFCPARGEEGGQNQDGAAKDERNQSVKSADVQLLHFSSLQIGLLCNKMEGLQGLDSGLQNFIQAETERQRFQVGTYLPTYLPTVGSFFFIFKLRFPALRQPLLFSNFLKNNFH